MSERGDINKKDSSGRGSGNQSSQGFGQASQSRKSNHSDQTGGMASTSQQKSEDQSANRNRSLGKQKK